MRGPALEDWGAGPEATRRTHLSLAAAATYRSGARETVSWLRRPQWPAPGGTLSSVSGFFCSFPTTRSADELHVWLSAFTERFGRESCSRPLEATMTLEREGVLLGTADDVQASFPLPAGAGTYSLRYEQAGQAPYTHRSTTVWTFRSAPPPDDGVAPVPLLTVDYELPLDTFNRPIGDTATLRVHGIASPTAATASDRAERPTVTTSIDGGQTWQPARLRRTGPDTFELALPDAPAGTAVSLHVDASDGPHNRIEQTLIDAYSA